MTAYTNRRLPDVKGRKAYVLGGAMYGACVSLMASAGYKAAKSVEEADIVVFVGGADVDPSLYGEEVLSGTSFNTERDATEEAVYKKCVELGTPMFGICRGAQFLHVMNGGKLWQHVDNHAGKPHLIVDTNTGETVEASSLHHQMICSDPATSPALEILAVTNDQIATIFRSEDLFLDLTKSGGNSTVEIEIEAGSYLKTKCFFVQGHPEIGCPEYRAWTMNNLEDFLLSLEKKPKTKLKKPKTEEMKVMVSKINKTKGAS